MRKQNQALRTLWERKIGFQTSISDRNCDLLRDFHRYPCYVIVMEKRVFFAFELAAPALTSLDDIIIALSTIVSTADQAIGCPYKAVSFHGSLQETQGLIVIDV